VAAGPSEADGVVRGVQPGCGRRRDHTKGSHLIDLTDSALSADAVIQALRLSPHPEGGHYRETWRDAPPDGHRGVGTAILFLLAAGERSHWHRVDAAELWLWHAGAALRLALSPNGMEETSHVLGPDLASGATVQAAVPAGCWQGAESLGAWTLVGCVVAPAFQFSGFELAAQGWRPVGSGCDDPDTCL
jgi:predicted cupin superfamily sugar epimerase